MSNDKKPREWEFIGHCLRRIEVPGGHIYLYVGDNEGSPSICFVPDSSIEDLLAEILNRLP